jgi:dynein heavy chain 2
LQGTFFASGYALGSTRDASASSGSRTQLKPSARLTHIKPADFQRIIERGMTAYAREVRDLQIVLFPEVLENVAHFDHVLSAPGSNLVAVGLTGIGRHTALAIVSALHGAAIHTLKVGRNYAMKQFKIDLKQVSPILGIFAGFLNF